MWQLGYFGKGNSESDTLCYLRKSHKLKQNTQIMKKKILILFAVIYKSIECS